MKHYDFLVLGGDGMQGEIVVKDLLSSRYSVYAGDLYDDRLKKLRRKKNFCYEFIDLRDTATTANLIKKSETSVVVNCAEGDWNLNVYKACLETKRHCIDLGSRIAMTRKQLALDSAFKKIGKTAVTGCGSVPGIGNVMLRHAARKFDVIDTVEAGFAWDSNIKKFVVPFSIESILEEFTLPAPYISNGRWRQRLPAESSVTRHYRSIGYQKAFLTEHAETLTFHHYFKKKGLKNIRFYAGFPEHSVSIIQKLIELKFSDKEDVRFDHTKINPAAFIGQLFKRLSVPSGYREWENLWVEVIGSKDRRRKTILMECLVPTLSDWEFAGCNVDTGMPASIIAQMILNNDIHEHGSFAPEAIVPEKLFFKRLRKKKLAIYENGVEWK